MSKAANAGELRTSVYFMKIDRQTDNEGFPKEVEINVFGKDKSVLTKWVNAHGSEVFTAMQLELREPVTITMRYSPLINEKLIVYRVREYEEAMKAGSDDKVKEALERAAYEVISVDNVECRNIWLEIKLQRKVAAR